MPRILIKNLLNSQLSLDIDTDTGESIRELLSPGEEFDIGDMLTLDEVNKNPKIQRLLADGKVDVEVETEPTDTVQEISVTVPHCKTKLSKKDDSTILISPAGLSASRCSFVLQDDQAYYFEGNLEASLGSRRLASTWYYIYLVPQGGATLALLAVASTDPPSSGPTGYTNFKCIGSVRTGFDKNLIPFSQSGDDFKYHLSHLAWGASSRPADRSPVAVSLSDLIPSTAEEVLLSVTVTATGGAGALALYVSGETKPLHTIPSGTLSGVVSVPTPGSSKEILRKLIVTRGAVDDAKIACIGWKDGSQ